MTPRAAAAKTAKILLWTLGGILLLITLAVIALLVLPPSWVRPVIGDKVTALLGRDMSVEGPVDLDWGWPRTSFSFGEIRLANLPDRPDADMVDIEKLEFTLDFKEILTGTLTIPEITITSPQIVLEKLDAETANWEFPAMSGAGAAAEATIPDSRGGFPVIGQLNITDGNLVYRDLVKDLETNLVLSTVEGSGGEGEQKLEVKGDGTLQGQSFSLDLGAGSINDLRENEKPFPLRIDLKMGGTSIKLDGVFTDPIKMTGVDASLDLRGENLADLFYLTGIPLPPSPPYSITGELGKEGEVWEFLDFKGKVGGSDLNGDLLYDTAGERGMVKAELVSELLDIKDLGGFIGVRPGEETKTKTDENGNESLLPDVPLELERLRATDMDVTLKATRINAPGVPIDNMDVRFDLQNGLLKIDPLAFGMANGKVDGVLVLDGRADVPKVKSDINLRRLSLKEFFDGTSFESFSSGIFGGRVQLEGNGRSLADVLATSNGRLTLSMGGGSVSLTIIEAAGLDVAELAPLLLGDDNETNIRCAVGDFKVADGILNSQVIVFDTDDTNVHGRTDINLKTETIDARIEANPKDPSILSLRTPILIQGKLKSPSILPEASGLAAKGIGAAVLGVVLTPVASIIPFIELGLGEDSDCRGLITRARDAQDKQQISAPVEGTDKDKSVSPLDTPTENEDPEEAGRDAREKSDDAAGKDVAEDNQEERSSDAKTD